MKQIIFTLFLSLGFILSYGQVKVHTGGEVVIGDNSATPDEQLVVKGNANIDGQFLNVGKGAGAAGAKIEFGTGRSVDGPATMDLVADASTYPDFGVRFVRFETGLSQFSHRGSGALVFNAVDGGTVVFQTSGVNRLRANSVGVLPGSDNGTSLGSASNRWTEVWAVNGTIQTSDMRTKSNIKESKYGLKEVLELKPVTFNWKDDPTYGQKIGFLAQDVEKVIPEVIRTKQVQMDVGGQRKLVDGDLKGLNYAELVPILVGAIQEQQEVIEDKEKRLQELENRLWDLEEMVMNLDQDRASESNMKIDLEDVGQLLQNRPNPFANETQIGYRIPENAQSAEISIFDIYGRILRTISIEHKGNGTIDLAAEKIPAGTYSYSLVIDGINIATKKMVLAR